MLEEIRISQLGVIDSSTLELGPGLTVITGETGAGKTMVVTALGLLLGGRADTGAVRSGAKQARVEGVVAVGDLDGFRTAVEDAGGEVEDDRVVLARNVAAQGRSRALVGGASVPVPTLAEVAEPLVAVHGQSDQHRLLRSGAQRAALDRFGGDGAGRDRVVVRRSLRPSWSPPSATLAEVVGSRPRARPGGRPAAVRPRRGRGGRPAARGGRRARRRGDAARVRRHAAHRRRDGPRGALQRGGRARRPGHDQRGARGRSRASASTTRRRASSPTGSPS